MRWAAVCLGIVLSVFTLGMQSRPAAASEGAVILEPTGADTARLPAGRVEWPVALDLTGRGCLESREQPGLWSCSGRWDVVWYLVICRWIDTGSGEGYREYSAQCDELYAERRPLAEAFVCRVRLTAWTFGSRCRWVGRWDWGAYWGTVLPR